MGLAVQTPTVDNAAAFTQLRVVLSAYNLDSVADAANVGKSTLYRWMAGQTKHPRIDTLTKTARVVGHDLQLSLLPQPKKVNRKRHLSLVKS